MKIVFQINTHNFYEYPSFFTHKDGDGTFWVRIFRIFELGFGGL